MERIYAFIPRELVEALGWTLFHSLWQGVIIAIFLGIMLLAFIRFSAHTRYIFTMLALLLMIASTSATFVKEYTKASERALIRQSVLSDPGLVVRHFREQIKNKVPAEINSSQTRITLKWILFKANFQKYFPWMVFLWMMGMTLLIVRFLGGMLVVQKLRYRQSFPLDEIWTSKVTYFIENLKISKKTKVLQSYAVQIPVTLGLFKPVILLPIGLLSGLSVAQVESIIAHEMAHIARRDYLFNLLQSVTEILFFYHPAIWWISSVARNEREHCCDDIAVELTGDKLNYAKALANIRVETSETSYVMAFLNKKNKLFKRVKRLLTPHPMKTNFKEGFIASCILFTGIILLTLGATASTGEFNVIPQAKRDTVKSVKGNPNESSAISGNKTTDSIKNTKQLKKENTEIFSELKGLDNLSENVEKELEVAFGDLDDLSTNEILKGIKGAMKEMDLNVIVGEAVKGAKAAINKMDINKIVNESLQDNSHKQQNDVVIAQEAIKGAQAALMEMDLNLIVNEALKGAEGALKEMDVQKLVQESLDKEIEEDESVPVKENKYLPVITKGTDSWNNYRKENQQILPDLSYISLSELNLDGINLVSISLSNASIEKSSLNKANMSGINARKLEVKDTQLNNVDFSNANLSEARFRTNVLRETSFENANLQSAIFTDCTLNKCDFRKANLRGTSFSDGTIDNCEFKGATADKDTRFPEGFKPSKKGIIMK